MAGPGDRFRRADVGTGHPRRTVDLDRQARGAAQPCCHLGGPPGPADHPSRIGQAEDGAGGLVRRTRPPAGSAGRFLRPSDRAAAMARLHLCHRCPRGLVHAALRGRPLSGGWLLPDHGPVRTRGALHRAPAQGGARPAAGGVVRGLQCPSAARGRLGRRRARSRCGVGRLPARLGRGTAPVRHRRRGRDAGRGTDPVATTGYRSDPPGFDHGGSTRR